MNHLQQRVIHQVPLGSTITLRIEKPRAIAFADAPAVEVVRKLTSTQERCAAGDLASGTGDSTGSSETTGLTVIKPYVRS